MSIEIVELTGGNALATVRGELAAKKNFEKFLTVATTTNLKDIGEEELCNPALLRRYATFMVDHFVTGDDARLMCDSVKQYLSGIFNVIKTRHPSNPNFTASGNDWYKQLRKNIDNKVNLRCFKLGV